MISCLEILNHAKYCRSHSLGSSVDKVAMATDKRNINVRKSYLFQSSSATIQKDTLRSLSQTRKYPT